MTINIIRTSLLLSSLFCYLGGYSPISIAIAETNLECRSVDQFSSPVGLTCINSAGAQFKRYQDFESGALGWQDLAENGKIWYDLVSDKMTHKRSIWFCNKSSRQSLPSKTDFQVAEAHAFREILRDSTPHVFWASTLHPFHRLKAFAFGPSFGDQGWGIFTRKKNAHGSARCISD